MFLILCPEPVDGTLAAARQLGLAFQMTNFLRDVTEDLDRGRVYIPAEDLRRFGADPRAREVTPEWSELMRFEIARTRDFYRQATHGDPVTCPVVPPSASAAAALYERILNQIEANRYDVFTRRARVALPIKIGVTAYFLLDAALPPARAHRVGNGAGPRFRPGHDPPHRGADMEHYQYLMVLAVCVAATLPLEVITGAEGVYRRPRRALRWLVGWTAMPFVAWDAVVARSHMWTYNPLYIVGWRPVLGLPVEELLFFVVVPLCALLTFEAVEASLSRTGQRG